MNLEVKERRVLQGKEHIFVACLGNGEMLGQWGVLLMAKSMTPPT